MVQPKGTTEMINLSNRDRFDTISTHLGIALSQLRRIKTKSNVEWADSLYSQLSYAFKEIKELKLAVNYEEAIRNDKYKK